MTKLHIKRFGVSSMALLAVAACQPAEQSDASTNAPQAQNSAQEVVTSASTEVARIDPVTTSDFDALVADFEAFELANDPSERARQGDLAAAREWTDLSAETLGGQLAAEAAFLERLGEIDASSLPASDQISYAVLDYILRFRVELGAYDGMRMPFNSDSGFFHSPSYAAASTRPMTIAEGDAWVAKVAAIESYFGQNLDWMRQGLDSGFTQPRIIVQSAVNQLEALSDPDTLHTILMAPIEGMSDALPQGERDRLLAGIRSAIDESAQPAYAAMLAFMRDEYLPESRDSIGISEVPEGRAYYQALVRYHTTTDTSPEEVHQRGLAEVARIREEMEGIIEELGFDGSFADFLEFLRTDPQFYAQTPEELLMHAAWISKRADDAMPRFFGHLPRLSYGVRPVPDTMAPSYTTGRYWPGDMENGIAGGYMVNTYDLTQRPLYTLPALTVHEAVPGHHHQGAIAQELEDVPSFRRNTYITAFGEGWGLYTENLAVDMGLYRTPYENFGRLTYEMWRACRLVIDTGMHYMGMTREEAEGCLLNNSALAPHNVRTEVLRYISWPGQALAYKTGELLMRDLRAEAEETLGADFDIRAFHDRLLEDGSMPLSALEAKMRAWIAEQAEQ
jgi:uncharacterized protein (DUF885 family)